MLHIYKASAGSGKTYTLAQEYIRYLFEAPVSDVRAHAHTLAVTFTKKATAEMKERILKELHQLSSEDCQKSGYYRDLAEQFSLTEQQIRERAATLLRAILEDYTHFAVSTIDAFFQQVVRSFARELGLPALYNLVLDGQEVVDQAVDDLLFSLEHKDAEQELKNWVHDFAIDKLQEGKQWNPGEEIRQISAHLLTERLQTELAAIRPILLDKNVLRHYREQLKAIIEQYEAAGLKGKRKLTDEQQKLRRDYFTAEAILKHLNELGVLSDVAEQIALTNRTQNRLPLWDINMLLHRVIDQSETPFIYEKIGTRIHHYMVDEFQDTSSLQWANFRPLIEDAIASGRDSLVVGDTKQSIYRWRNSDWHLLEGLEQQIKDSDLPEKKHNYRSAATIVETNNMLFERYFQYVANLLDSELAEIGDGRYGQTVRQAYSTLEQIPVHRQLSGYVQMQFFDTEKTYDAEELALEAMLPVLEDVKRRGAKMGQVAVLIRKSSEAQRVTQFLVENGYSVQSAEGLLLRSHPAVSILICLLELSIHPEDEILQARLGLLLGEKTFTEEQQRLIDEASRLPLYEQVQALIVGLGLQDTERATAYLTAFQDLVYHYCESQVVEVGQFLEYWHRREDKASIPASASEDAIQIMTVHKAKGLEWDIVLIPMMSWSVAASTMDSRKLLWCRPKKKPFSDLPLVPVGNSKDLSKTHFADAYAEELRDLYIDNLNLTYVAFTRPCRELYAWGQVAPVTSKGDSIKNIGNLWSVLLREELTDGVLSIGGKGDLTLKETESQAANKQCLRPMTMRIAPMGNRLQLRTHVREDEELSRQDIGNVMHEWLARIDTREDEQSALEEITRMGIAREKDMDQLREKIAAFWQLTEPYDWFSGRYRVLREQDILTPSGNTYRPDRVMIDGANAIVIDYKFGEHRRPGYREQVRNYMTLLGQMGYRTSGYLVYVTLDTIEAV